MPLPPEAIINIHVTSKSTVLDLPGAARSCHVVPEG
jgi:hypothetical protein